jgi:hypothetical protein
MAADGSVNIPRIKPGDNIEAVNTALTAVERSLSEVREAVAAGKATADIVSNLDNALKAMKAEQAELVQRIAARDAAATDYGHDSDLALYVRSRGEEPRLRSVTDGGAPIQRTAAELKAHKAVRLFGEDSETYGFQPGLLDDPAPKCEWQRAAQVAYEEVAIAELCTGRTAAKARARLARLFSVAPNPEIKRLFSDASGTGTEWIPSEVVMPELERDLMLQTRGRVAGLFGVTPMSSKTVSSPFLSGGLRPYLKGAQTADDPARYTASTATTAERSRTAVGMAVRAQLDDDTTEEPMQGPLRTVPGASPSATNRNASTLPKRRFVALTAPTATGETAVTNVTAATVRKVYGLIQEDCPAGKSVSVQRLGEGIAESDGSATIAVGDPLIVVGTSSVATAGRVATLGASPTAGSYMVVGQAKSAVGTTDGGEEVRIELCTPYLVYVPA